MNLSFAFVGVLSLIVAPMRASATPPGHYTVDTFIHDLKANHALTLDEGVRSLPASIRSNYALVYIGQAVQQPEIEEVDGRPATVNPRAIMFNDDASFVASFTVDGPVGGQEIEFLQFNFQTQAFDLAAIEFPMTEAQLANLTKTPTPELCFGCHKADPRPNWPSFPQRDGVFGSAAGLLAPNEIPLLWNFNHNAYIHNPRYAALIRDTSDPLSPYALKPTDANTVVGLSHRPNDRLAILFNRLNAKRVFRILHQDPAIYQKLKWTLLWELECAPADYQHDNELTDLLFKFKAEPSDWTLEFGDSRLHYNDSWTDLRDLVAELIIKESGVQFDGVSYVGLPHFLLTTNPADLSFQRVADNLGRGVKLNASACRQLEGRIESDNISQKKPK